MRRWGAGWVVLVVTGSMATAASALVGLRALTRAWQVDELDDDVPVPVLDPGAKGPLLGLAPGQHAEVHYLSRGCFHGIDRLLTFDRVADGRMRVRVRGAQPWQGEVHERLLTEAEVLALDRDLLFGEKLHGGLCTTHTAYDVTVFAGARRLSHSHFENERCQLPGRPGDQTVDGLASELRLDRLPAAIP